MTEAPWSPQQRMMVAAAGLDPDQLQLCAAAGWSPEHLLVLTGSGLSAGQVTRLALAAVGVGVGPDAVVAAIWERCRNPDWDREVSTTPGAAPVAAQLVVAASASDLVALYDLSAGSGTAPEVLAVLAVDPDRGVRCRVGRNRGTPSAVLTTLAGDLYRGVRRAVAGNPGTATAVLTVLAADSYLDVRQAVVGNPEAEPTRVVRVVAATCGQRQLRVM